ncbi:Crp/Fnr family transcriptional regulator [Membranicola marinus]|uniref:Crp/Fnr family transcriptional regulator n=1 Tax=Membranihabitans marinus TaxID=1227546 RepID=A0A953HVX4_9BACT|nr:Crp/Fnr family transcriptional regulator [Membranihabitans marinus]MBY5958803.1 Crp/Fnr family transcriptional regulator [Membranihabitans marinus]
MIPEKLLLQHGGRIDHIKSGGIIFQQEEYARNFYQIKKGQVQMSTINDDGKEFIQGIMQSGESFGEPPLFVDIAYPASAHAMKQTDLIVLPKDKFLKFLSAYPHYYTVLLRRLSLRLHYKATMAQVISNEKAEKCILTLIDYMKQKEGYKEHENYKVPLTRQQIGDLVGLRVETVIRTISSLKEQNILNVQGGKIIR